VEVSGIEPLSEISVGVTYSSEEESQ